jgi:hypothetical protein
LIAGIERRDLSVEMRKSGFCQDRGSLGRDIVDVAFQWLRFNGENIDDRFRRRGFK